MLALLSHIFQFKKKLTAYYDKVSFVIPDFVSFSHRFGNSKTDSVTNGDIL